VLNREIPFLRIGLPVCMGIISGLYLKPDLIFLAASLIFIITGFGISLLFNKRQLNILYGFPLTFSLYLSGLMLYINEKNSLSDLEPGPETYLCSLAEFPEEKDKSFRIIVRLHALTSDTGNIPLKGSLLIYIRKDTMINSLLPGDFMKIRCSANPVVNRGNPYEFDYKFYMENHGIKYFSYATMEDITGLVHPDHRKLKYRALIIREKIIDMYEDQGITGDRLALVAAITLGQKSMLDPEQKQIFIKAGVMHIMAVSGLHAVILSIFIFNLLFFMKRKFNTLRIIIAVILLWSFAFVTGLTPSVIRATIMFSFLQAGKLIRRDVNSLNSVLASAFILLIIHPSLLFDAGFLLSYSSVVFIICFYRDFYLMLRFKTWIADKIWQSAAVTILAQAGTLPLTVALFNRFPTWFILTNIIIVPLSSFLIIVGCLVPLTYPLKFISQPLASLLGYLTGITEMLTQKASDLPFSTIENIGMGIIETGLLFSFIFLFVMSVLNRKSFALRYPLIALLLFVSAGTVRSIADRTSSELIVYNGIGTSPVGIRTGKIMNLYSDSDTIPPEVAKHCFTKGLKINLMRSDSHDHLLKISGKNIIICNKLTKNALQEIKPDMVILKGKYPAIQKEIGYNGLVEGIILGSDVVLNNRINLELSRLNPDTIHVVRSSGAFRRKL